MDLIGFLLGLCGIDLTYSIWLKKIAAPGCFFWIVRNDEPIGFPFIKAWLYKVPQDLFEIF